MRASFSFFLVCFSSFSIAFGDEVAKPNSIGVTAEWIELELKYLPKLLREHGGEKESSALYAEVEKMVEEGKAERIEIVYARSAVEERLKAESIEEFIYPTEYDPPEIPNTLTLIETGGDDVPMTGATPTAFETRDLGVTIEVDSHLGEGNEITLVLAAEDVRFLERDYHINPDVGDGRGNNGVWMPKFYTMRVRSQLRFDGEGVALVGTFTPPGLKNTKKRRLLFIRVQLLNSNTPKK